MLKSRWFVLAGLFAAVCGVPMFSAVGELTAEQEGNQISVKVDGALFTAYKFDAKQKYPYFFPVNGPLSGQSITTETSEPYPHHHSLFFGCDRVNGGNYWQDENGRGQILSQGPKIAEAKGNRIVITDECLWKQPDQDPVIRDTRRIVITAPDKTHRFIDFEITLEPLVEVRIEKTNHSLFSGRVAPELSVQSGGVLVNAEGKLKEEGTFGAASPWCDYAGKRGDTTEGMAIFQHSSNRWYPSPWFTRDYGFFSPTPMYWPEGDATLLPKGQKLTLRYRVVAHAGNVTEAGIADLFKAYEKAPAE